MSGAQSPRLVLLYHRGAVGSGEGSNVQREAVGSSISRLSVQMPVQMRGMNLTDFRQNGAERKSP